MCARFYGPGMTSISRLHVCLDLSLDPSRIFIVIGLMAGCKFFTVVPVRKKCPVAPASAMASLLVIFMINLEYSVSIYFCVWLFMIDILSSSSSPLAVASSENLLLVLCWVGYNKFTVFGSRFSLSILNDLDPVAPNHHPLHCCYYCCCFQVSCWSITQFAFRSF